MKSILKNKTMFKNKKGDFQSVVILIMVIFVVAIAAIIFSKVFLMITSELKTQPEFSNTTIDTIELVEDRTIPLLDFLIFFSLIALMIGLIISSIYIDVHPALIVIFIIALIIAIFLGGQIANIYSEITTNSELSATSEQFNFSNAILGQHFPIIIAVVGMIIIVILYGKSRRVGEQV